MTVQLYEPDEHSESSRRLVVAPPVEWDWKARHFKIQLVMWLTLKWLSMSDILNVICTKLLI